MRNRSGGLRFILGFFYLVALGPIGVIGSIAAAGQLPQALRYNQVQWKASHNSYAQPTDILSQLRDYRIRSIEFDLHVSQGKLIEKEPAPAGDFLVFHTANNAHSNCRILSQCFDQVAAFHQGQPDHEVITIFFDMAGVGEAGHTKADLYKVFQTKLTPASIFTPGDLLRACPGAQSLQESVTRPGCGWPLLSDLQGKVILVVSDGRDDIIKAGYDLRQDLLFLVSKNTDPGRMREDPNLVFFNLAGPRNSISVFKDAGFVTRSYWLNTEKAFLQAKRLGANHLATDRIDPKLYPWSGTQDQAGHPFQKIE